MSYVDVAMCVAACVCNDSSGVHHPLSPAIQLGIRPQDERRVAERCSVLQCVAVCCSVLQRVAACCNVLQRVALALHLRLLLLSLCAASRMWVSLQSVVIVPPEGGLAFR